MKYAHIFWIMTIMWSAILRPTVQAELPPSAYEEMQQKASDVFRINVLQVMKSATDDPHKAEIRIVADVLKVGRSVAKIRAGELITIRYFVIERPPGWVGPGEVPIPDERAEVPAFLTSSPESTDYTPAAGAMTFSTFR
jgi:hypothetical protein